LPVTTRTGFPPPFPFSFPIEHRLTVVAPLTLTPPSLDYCQSRVIKRDNLDSFFVVGPVCFRFRPINPIVNTPRYRSYPTDTLGSSGVTRASYSAAFLASSPFPRLANREYFRSFFFFSEQKTNESCFEPLIQRQAG
jgi:hypothetical protein